MFARRFRTFLKIHDRTTFRKLSCDYVEHNLKLSSQASTRSTELLARRICLPAKSMPPISYSQLSKTLNIEQESQNVEDDNEVTRKVRVTENKCAYDVLAKNPRYKNTIVPPIIPDETFSNELVEKILMKKWTTSSSASELLENFRILSYHSRSNHTEISDRHTQIFEALSSVSKDLLDDQIWLLLRYLEMWHPMRRATKPKILEDLEESLDHQCWKRGLEWDTNELLMTCDLMFHLRRLRQSKFVKFALKKLGTKPSRMTSDNYPHYMFVLNLGRMPSINVYELEYRLESIIEEYDVEELAVIAMGFFKTETPIRNSALSTYIIQKCVDNMTTLHEIFVTAVMKMARHSLHLRDREILRTLIRRFLLRIKDTSTTGLVQTAQTGATTLVYEKQVMDLIMNELVERGLADARLKDIERTLFSLMIFNYPKEFPLYQLAVDELRKPVRKSEQRKFAQTYACSLMYLSLVGIYPLDIISSLMSHEYIKDVYRNNAFKVGREYLILECGLNIEVPEYKGPFLPDKIYNYVAKKHASAIVWRTDPTERTQTYQKFLAEVLHYLKGFVGEKNFYLDQVLPQHNRADIILCLDSDNNFIPPEPILSACPSFRIKFAPEPKENYKWMALVLLSSNHLFRGTALVSGTLNAKLRQLEMIGYTPIPIKLPTWSNFKNTERPEYLKNLLTEHVTSNKVNSLS